MSDKEYRKEDAMYSYELFVNSALDIDTGDLKIKLAILEELQKLNTKLKKFDKIYLLVINKTMILYYYCFILDEFCKNNLNQGNFASVDMRKFNDFEFPMPPLEEQRRIVQILDRFDKLCNDLTEGLPAEIEARKKQYEYYRDKLLTFNEIRN